MQQRPDPSNQPNSAVPLTQLAPGLSSPKESENRYHNIDDDLFPLHNQNFIINATYLPMNPRPIQSGVAEGIPVNIQNINNYAEVTHREISNRRLYWKFSRRAQSFTCLNICYMVILLISLETTFTEYRSYTDTCPTYAAINLLFSILNIAWIVITCIGIIAVHRRSLRVLKFYVVSVAIIMILRVIQGVHILSVKNSIDSCVNEGAPSNALIGGAVITLLIFALFYFIGRQLLRLLITAEYQSERNRGQNANPVNNGNHPNLNHQYNPNNAQRANNNGRAVLNVL